MTASPAGTGIRTPRVLVVDDDREQLRIFSRFLSRHNYQVVAARSAARAMVLARAVQMDLALIDIAMPGMDGLSLIKEFRLEPQTARLPIILMSGLPVPEAMLEITAEHFCLESVHAKGGDLQVLLRNVQTALDASAASPTLSYGRFLKRENIVLDTQTHKAWIGTIPVPGLTPKCFDLFCLFLRNGRSLTRESILARIWPDSDNVNLVDVTVHRLRKCLSSLPSVRIDATGDGYQLALDGSPLPRENLHYNP